MSLQKLLLTNRYPINNEYSGYMSPEYAMEGQISDKSDVFSFGVLLLEIVSGKRNNYFLHDDQALNLVGYVRYS